MVCKNNVTDVAKSITTIMTCLEFLKALNIHTFSQYYIPGVFHVPINIQLYV